MVHWLAAMTPRAPNKAFVTQVDVSTLPATTAAGDRGFSIQPSGRMICSGLRHPAFSGISSSTRVRHTYKTAAVGIARGALKLFVDWGLVPLQSIGALRNRGS